MLELYRLQYGKTILGNEVIILDARLQIYKKRGDFMQLPFKKVNILIAYQVNYARRGISEMQTT